MPLSRPVMLARLVAALWSGGVGCAAPAAGRRQASETGRAASAFAVDSALAVIAAAPLWPGFEPLRTPVAMFDGTRTYLFRHPQPPADYAAVPGYPGHPGVVAREGRDPAVTANTSAQLGGVATATVMLGPRGAARDVAALTVHELFHVFQRARHPSWQGNEADLFTYPVEDSAALALRREETSALARAVDAPADDSLRCLASAFLDARRRRFALAGAAAAAYERGTELNEGLAQYVERRAAGARITLDPADAPAAQVRQRAYAVGAALASVLDRARPDWRTVLEGSADSATPPLDAILSDAIGPIGLARPCLPTATQRTAWAAQAGDDVRALVAERARARAEYLGRGGWRLVVEAGDSPFFPQGFDPLNVSRVSPTEILHTRFLKLQGTLGAVELLGGAVLTEGAAGAHPLFNGVRRVTAAGLPATVQVRDSAGTLVVDGGVLRARLRGVRADTTGQSILIRRR